MAKFEVKLISQGADVTDRTISQKDFDDIGVVAPSNLRWYRGQPQVLEDPDPTLLEYFKQHKDEFSVKEVDAPKPK
jgi:hypothetical protein